jgi:AbrB family looped-hinge helix DNA binding protein
MQDNVKNTPKMKVFPKGQVIIPVSLRRKYNINIGDQIEFIDFKDGIFLKPSKQRPTGRTVTEELFGMLKGYAVQTALPNKDEVNRATDSGFTEGWIE